MNFINLVNTIRHYLFASYTKIYLHHIRNVEWFFRNTKILSIIAIRMFVISYKSLFFIEMFSINTY